MCHVGLHAWSCSELDSFPAWPCRLVAVSSLTPGGIASTAELRLHWEV